MASSPAVTKAVIPAAGLGTRFLPATKSQPKEMLPVIDKPAIQYVVEEAVRAGIEDICIVTSSSKRSLEDHFDRNFELEHLLNSKGKDAERDEVVALADLADFHYVRQGEPLGLGHELVAEEDHERVVADVAAGHRHRVAEAQGRRLSDVDAGDVLRDHAAHQFEERLLVGRFQLGLELVGLVEMVFDGALVAAGDEDHFGDAGRDRFFDGVLDQRLVDDRQHLLRLRLGGGKEAAAQAGDGKDGFTDLGHR